MFRVATSFPYEAGYCPYLTLSVLFRICQSPSLLGAYAEEYKTLGQDQQNSARRANVLLCISRSWAALAHQLENLTIIVKDEGK